MNKYFTNKYEPIIFKQIFMEIYSRLSEESVKSMACTTFWIAIYIFYGLFHYPNLGTRYELLNAIILRWKNTLNIRLYAICSAKI